MQEFNAAEGVRRLQSKTIQHTHSINDDLLHIDEDEFRWFVRHLAQRDAPGTCLLCDSDELILIDPLSEQTSLTHDACRDSPIERHRQ